MVEYTHTTTRTQNAHKIYSFNNCLFKSQSMHWATPKTKDRMLPEAGATTGAGGSGGLSAASPNPAHRRASEGGAALYYGNRKTEWGTENSDVANKFRNYEI
uniref:J domain-containing protein n=1 Tax=Bactrocera latifrons TaxID=174628 RepID=A0A0K8WMA4_BACLA